MFPASIDLTDLDGSNGFAINGAAAQDNSGVSVSGAGDVNGDGIDDLIIGGPGATANGDLSGASFVVFGSAAGFDAQLELSLLNGDNGFRANGIAAYGHSGQSASGAGDINGDGFDDLVIGAPGVRGSGTYNTAGAAYVLFGSASGIAADVDLAGLNGSNGFTIGGIVLPGSSSDSGASVAGAGDVNGDGIDDLIIGSPGASSSHVVFGSRAGFAASLELSALDGSNGFAMSTSGFIEAGSSVAGAGDVNGDGIDDLIVGARSGGAATRSGQSFVVFGSESGFVASLDLSTLDGTNGFRLDGAENDGTGTAVSGAGDINGDGFADLIVGAYFARPGGVLFAGKGYIVFGTADGFSPTLDLSSLDGEDGFTINGGTQQEAIGISVSTAGDVNADGIGDLIIGSLSDAASYVVFGTTAGFGPSLELSALDGRNGFKIEGGGRSVSAAGDVNGDGIDDLIVGSPNASPDGRAYAGASYVIFGRRDALFSDSDDVRDLNGFDLGRLTTAQATHALGGDDVVTLSETQNLGVLFVGNAGDDTIDGSSHGDRIRGDSGNDTLRGHDGDDTLWGTQGGDLLDGGDGADHLNGGHDGDSLRGGDGDDAAYGRGGDDLIFGGSGDDLVNGGGGEDSILGNGGSDRLIGAGGQDVLAGGTGADVFAFAFTSDSRPDAPDRIVDFARGDLIDLSRIDAVAGGADDAFAFIGGDDFTAPGQLRFFISGTTTFIQGNTLGSGGTELLVALHGVQGIGEGDLVL